MTASMVPVVEFWLPALRLFMPGQPVRCTLARADRLDNSVPGYPDGLAAYFKPIMALMPVAALTRQWLAGDAGDACWLCADPAWVQPDPGGVRLLACGQLSLSPDEVHQFADILRPVFEETGLKLEISAPDHWHLRLPGDLLLPHFDTPGQTLGEDLYHHLPDGIEGRRWRILLNEVQMLLHQHPHNEARRNANQPPLNSLWFWGAGVLPDHLHSCLEGVISNDVLMGAMAAYAGIRHIRYSPDHATLARPGWLVDWHDKTVTTIEKDAWPYLQNLLQTQPVCLSFLSGERWLHKPWHRWRWWRYQQGAI